MEVQPHTALSEVLSYEQDIHLMALTHTKGEKGKDVPVHTMKAYIRHVEALLILNFGSSRWRSVVIFKSRPLYPGDEYRYSLHSGTNVFQSPARTLWTNQDCPVRTLITLHTELPRLHSHTFHTFPMLRFTTSSLIYNYTTPIRTAFFCAVTEKVVVFYYRQFGTTCRSFLDS